MNLLIENNIISEMQCEANFSYIIHEKELFLPTEYKVLQHQSDSCFVKCMKLMFNGEPQLYYLTSELKPLAALLPQLESDGFLTIVSNLISDVIAVKNNGFLHCHNIDIAFERVFVNPSTYKVQLIYLPIKKKVYKDTAVFETELRTNLIKVIGVYENLQSPRIMQLSADLSNGMLTLEDLAKKLKGRNTGTLNTRPDFTQKKVTVMSQMKLSALNAPAPLEIVVSKDEFVIGKKESMVDAAITFNNMISRVHCKIVKENQKYYVVDLGSSNGTYVNKKRLQANVPCAVNNEDIVRMANSDFRVIIH